MGRLGGFLGPPNRPRMIPRQPRDGPRRPQDGCKTAPRRPQAGIWGCLGVSLGVYGGVQDERSFQDSLRGGGGCPGPILGGSRLPFGLCLMIFQTLLGMVLVPFWIIFEPPVNCSARFLMLRSCVVRLPSMKTPAFSKGHNQ